MGSRRQSLLEPAWLLHHMAYRDSSLILEAFTREHGRIGVVARGARSGKSRHRAMLQPFMPLRLSWSGTGELVTLIGVEPDGQPLQLAGTALMGGYYANELLLRLLARNDEHARLFEHYARMLTGLAAGEDIAVCLRSFERALLEELGYGLNLDHDIVEGRAIDPAADYDYVLEQGPRRVSGATSAASTGRLVFRGQTLLNIRDLRLHDAATRVAARRLFTLALDLYLGHRPLKSRQVLEAVLRLGRTSTDETCRRPHGTPAADADKPAG
jgi:DNA repair protein RecO (recombination protein O)